MVEHQTSDKVKDAKRIGKMFEGAQRQLTNPFPINPILLDPGVLEIRCLISICFSE